MLKMLVNPDTKAIVKITDGEGKALDVNQQRAALLELASQEWQKIQTKDQVVEWLKRFRMTGYGSLVKDVILPSAEQKDILEVSDLVVPESL